MIGKLLERLEEIDRLISQTITKADRRVSKLEREAKKKKIEQQIERLKVSNEIHNKKP